MKKRDLTEAELTDIRRIMSEANLTKINLQKHLKKLEKEHDIRPETKAIR